MDAAVSYPLAKLLKEKGFDLECEKGWFLPHPTIAIQKGLEPNAWQLIPSHPLLNQIKAPTIAEVVMWLYEKHGIWISVIDTHPVEEKWEFQISVKGKGLVYSSGQYPAIYFSSPTEAYEAAIVYALNNIVK